MELSNWFNCSGVSLNIFEIFTFIISNEIFDVIIFLSRQMSVDIEWQTIYQQFMMMLSSTREYFDQLMNSVGSKSLGMLLDISL